MFNGDRHDFQGTPGLEYPPNSGKQRNMFYYIHKCDGVSDADMPVAIAAKQYYWGTRPVSGYLFYMVHSILNVHLMDIYKIYRN